MLYLMPYKNIWATTACFFSSHYFKLYKPVLSLSLHRLEFCSAVLLLCGSCHPALTPPTGFPWAFAGCSASLEMAGGQLSTALTWGCAVIVGGLFCCGFEIHTNAQEPWTRIRCDLSICSAQEEV